MNQEEYVNFGQQIIQALENPEVQLALLIFLAGAVIVILCATSEHKHVYRTYRRRSSDHKIDITKIRPVIPKKEKKS